ncbi:MAG: formylglycine-generating enzyme family protein [Pseudomonadota bacterium]
MRISITTTCIGLVSLAAFAGGALWAQWTDGPVPSARAAVAAPICPADEARGGGEVLIKGGRFMMGSDNERPEEKSAHPVVVSDFFIDTHEVTNAQFAAFVEATGYVTIAERGIGAAGRGRMPETLLRPGGMVFSPPRDAVADLSDVTKWWRWVEGANWRAPEGPGSSLDGRAHHPVVQVSVEDAYAYAKWTGRALPTEAQWEFAARGGLDGAKYAWGDTYDETDGTKANTWQGAFPSSDTKLDGAHGTAPAGCYEPNGYGLHDMAGNVWEYVQNWWVPTHPAASMSDPLGPTPRDAAPFGSALGPRVTVKGGSWLCAPSYCARFRPSGRQPQELALGSNHIGFRTVRAAVRSEGAAQ